MINLSALTVRERAVTLFAIVITAIIGLLAFNQIGRAEDPNLTIKTMVVTVAWPGATAAEMATQVADKLEKRVQELRWFDNVQTDNRPGMSVLQITLKDTTPPAAVREQWYQVRKKLTDEAARLPQGVHGLSFNDEFSDVYFALYALHARGVPQRQLAQRAEGLREQLLAVPGVQKVDLIGEQAPRFEVAFDTRRLAAMGLTLDELLAALAQSARSPASGFVDTRADRVYLRMAGGLATEEDIADTPLSLRGRTLRVGDLATVQRAYEDPPRYMTRFNGQDSLMIGVVMQQDYNGDVLGADLRETLNAIRSELPLGTELAQTADQSKVIARATGEFAGKFAVALVTVMIVSFIALGLRPGLIVAAAVPLTLAMTFALMLATGKNFDRITTGALILSLGLLVDDAIIAIEMMLVKMQQGMDRVQAAAFAWTSTAAPMLTGTLITIVGFLPVGFAASSSGEYAGNIFWITAFALITSWVVAVTFTPYLGVLMLPKPGSQAVGVGDASGGHESTYDTPRYQALRRLITRAVEKRRWTLGLTLGAFVVSVVLMATVVSKQFFPSSDRPELLVEIYMPEGSAIGATAAKVAEVEALVQAAPQTLMFSSFVGGGAPRFFLAANPELPNPAFAKIVVQTADDKARDAMKQRLDAQIAEGAVTGARIRTTQLLLGPPVPFPVGFRVLGPDPIRVQEIATQVLGISQQVDLARDMHLEWSNQAASLELQIDRAKVSELGLSPQAIARQLALVLNGVPAAQVREGNRTIDIVLRANIAGRAELAALDDIVIRNAQGQAQPLRQLVRSVPVADDALLKRYNRQFVMNVRGDTQSGVQPDDASAAIERKLVDLRANLPAGYRIDTAGTVEETIKANAAIGALGPATLLLMLSLIMVQVRSFPAMWMTMLTAPLGLIGAVAGLLLFNAPFGFTAILGLLGLFGILIRNTLILIEQIRENHDSGMALYNAVIEATVQRARPVVLTAVAGMLAFLPLTLTALWGPMAIVLIGGFGVGTVLTLLVLPALYVAWFRVKSPGNAGASMPLPALRSRAAS